MVPGRWGLRCAVLGGLGMWASACGPSAPGPPPPPREAMAVEVDGCALLVDGARCIRQPAEYPTRCESTLAIDPGTAPPAQGLRIRVPKPHARGLMLAVDGRTVDTPPVAVDDAAEWTVVVDPSAQTLSLRSAQDGAVRWTLELAPPVPEPALTKSARRALADPSAPAPWVALAASLERTQPQARVITLELMTEWQLTRAARADDPTTRTDAYRRAVALADETVALLLEMGDVARASCNARRASFMTLVYLHDTEATQVWQQRLHSMGPLPAPARVATAYHRGLFAQRMGDLPAALEAYAQVEAGAHHDPRRAYLLASLPQRALVLAALRRPRDVEALLDRVQTSPHSMRCRDWLRILNNVAWTRLQLSERGVAIGDPAPELHDVAMILADRSDPDDPCDDAALESTVQINLALAALQRGHHGRARVLLDRMIAPDPGLVGASARAWMEVLELRVRLEQGERAALIEWLMLHGDDGPHPLAPGQRWRINYWRGRAFEALGRTEEAIAAYSAAESAVALLVRRLDYDVAGEGLLLGHQPSAGRLTALLVASGRRDEALCVARRARGRMDHLLDRTMLVAALSVPRRRRWREALDRIAALRDDLDRMEQTGWALPPDAAVAHRADVATRRRSLEDATRDAFGLLYGDGSTFAPLDDRCATRRIPDPGAVHLLYFPLDPEPGGPWMGFAFNRTGVVGTAVVEHLPQATTLQPWSDALLAPFAAAIDVASHVEVLPVGPLWSVPFAALPWHDDVLLARVPVTVGLDLARRHDEPASPSPAPARRALVVGAPQGDLPAAEQEAQGVATSLRNAGWAVELLLRERADAPRVRRALGQAQWLHYAGHGRRAGTEGWSSRLHLAADGELGVRDVLALPSAPPVAMLLACDATPASAQTLGGGMSLARAFVLAGTEVVVASDGALDDVLAEQIARRIYASGELEAAALPRVLQRARLASRDGGSAAWSRIRVLRP